MNWVYWIIGCLAVMNAAIGVYVFLKNAKRPLNLVFLIFSLGIAGLCANMVLLFATRCIIFDRLLFESGFCMVLGFVLLSIKFPEDNTLQPRLWLSFLPLLALAILTPFGFLVTNVVFRENGTLEPISGPGMPYFGVAVGAYFLFGVYNLWKKYRSLSGTSRLQLQYLALGAGIFAISLFIFSVFLPILGFFKLNVLGPASSFAFVVTVAYAIARHRLLDIRLVIQRSIIYFFLFAVVASVYLGIIFAGHVFLGHSLHSGSPFSIFAGMFVVFVGIFTMPLLERSFRRLTDSFFFRNKYRYSSAIRSLSAVLNNNFEMEKMASRAAQALKTIIRVEYVQLVLFDKTTDTTLRAFISRQQEPVVLENKVFVPVRTGRKIVAALILGPKRSGEPYYDEDLQLLATFADQAAVALEKARLFGKIQQYSVGLEARVRERTAELEDLQEEQRQMMIDVSHRLQTPLTLMKSELNFMRDHPGSISDFQNFERSIDGISKFIYDLLSLATLDIRKSNLKREKVDMSLLLRDLAEYFGVMATENGVSLFTHIEPGVFMYANKDQIEEMITNIVGNAFKYLDSERERKVLVKMMSSDAKIILEIEDTGRGIAPDDLEKVFERFYRGKLFAGGSESGSPSGTGLGLAIAKKIAESHGGSIEIFSQVDQGTTVTIFLNQ